jgi:hypothetical protein
MMLRPIKFAVTLRWPLLQRPSKGDGVNRASFEARASALAPQDDAISFERS